jgi:DNA-binding NtrC family response regulator
MKNVLVLEDDRSVLTLLRGALDEYHLIEAATAEEALLLCIDEDCQFDFLIAPVKCTRKRVPTISGIQVALLLRSIRPTLPLILTASYPVSGWGARDSSDLERLGSKSVAILQKPFEAPVLLYVVRDVIGLSQAEKVRTA